MIYKKDLYLMVAAFDLLLQGKKYAEIADELQVTQNKATKLVKSVFSCMNNDFRIIRWRSGDLYERPPHHIPYVSTHYKGFWTERFRDWVEMLFKNPEYTDKHYEQNWQFAAVFFQEQSK